MMDNPSARISVSSLNHTLENGTSNGMEHQRGSGLGLTISTGPLHSPTAAYPGPRPPYSSTSAATPSSHSNFDYMSPPSSRRTTMDDKAPLPRQSLPSITEALKGDNLPFSSSTSSHTLPAPSRPEQMPPARSLPEPPPGPHNPFSQPDRFGVRSAASQETLTGQDNSKSSFSSINATAPLPPSTFRSTPRSPRNGYPQYSPSYQPSPHTKDFGPLPNVSPNPRPPHQSPYSYSMGSADTPSAIGGSDQSRFSPPTKYENGRPPVSRPPPTPSSYGTAVKRHIDTYDTECALNQILDYSNRANEFARKWSQKSNQRHRTGYMPEGSLPGLPEVDDLMRQLNSVHQSYEQLRSAAIVQQQVLAEEQALASKQEVRDPGLVGFAHEIKTNGEFTVGDSKKRRGKAAPPGRCHSCNRAETPEWRRGPDGARTLCNACGLHYAKLTRKGVANKNGAAPGSNLRPKEVGSAIPS